MFKRAAFAFSFLLCTSAIAADEPQWLKDVRARESKSLQPAELKSKDDWFKARTPGKLVNTIEKVEGSYSVELDIGGDANVHCEVIPDGVDLGNALRLMLVEAIEEIESSQGKIEARALENTDAGAYGAVPYISLSWLYRVASPQGPKVGALKQFIMEKGGPAVYCAHNDLGFTRTFAAITRAFAESLETQASSGTPQYVDIATVSMTGAKVGFAISTVERDSEGDIKARQMSSMLIATSDGAVRSQDATLVYWLRPDGTLINAGKTEVSNGELAHDLSLKNDEGTWIVKGEVQGKAVETALPKDSQPGNWMALAQQLRDLLGKPDAVGREHTMGIWLANNPDKLTVARTIILAKQDNERFNARGEIGGITASLTLEKATGMPSTIDMKIGPLNVKLERVYVSGSF